VSRGAALAAAALLVAGCSQFTAVDGTPVAALARPILLMHRGCGNDPDYRQNTLECMRYGAGLYDGAEADLQLSDDGTIWLSHDNEVYDCAGAQVGCFQGMSDAQLDAVAECPDGSHYVRLSAVFQAFSAEPPLLSKIVALDVKDQLCGSLGFSEAKEMAGALDLLVRSYHMDWRLLVESDQDTFMDRFHDLGTPTYLFVEGYGGIDPIIADADRQHATGISYRYFNAPYERSLTDGLRNVGLRTMVWPVDDPAVIPPIWAMHPDVIETDLSDFYAYVPAPAPF